MKSGMLAAETIMEALEKDVFSAGALKVYADKIDKSWIHNELWAARNFGQALSKKGLGKFITLGAQFLTGGRGFTDPMPIVDDADTMEKLSGAPAELKPEEADNKLYLDKLTGVYMSGTKHEEDQPCHLQIPDEKICTGECYQNYRMPCTRFCPGQVYEMEQEKDGSPRLKLNPSNCLHCKTCEIKDPYHNIIWTCPEGGGGPNYSIV